MRHKHANDVVLIWGVRKRSGTFTRTPPLRSYYRGVARTGQKPRGDPRRPKWNHVRLRTLHIWKRLLTLVPRPLIKQIRGLISKEELIFMAPIGAKMWDNLRLGAVVGPFRHRFKGLYV